MTVPASTSSPEHPTAASSPLSRPAGPPTIRVLDPLVASQIAAGEVVERPASIVRELVDNAIDAGATRVTVELEQGGIELVRVTDDGHGMPADQLILAVTPHATSKVQSAADLERVLTMGFRGEALASIASVSRMSLRSRPRALDAAAVLDLEGDKPQPVRPAAGPVGTSVTVRTLFFNTPARRKFLRSVATEQDRCAAVVKDHAIARPGVGFRVVADGRTLLDVQPGQDPRARVLAVLGPELADQLLEVSHDEPGTAPPAPLSPPPPGLAISTTDSALNSPGTRGPMALWGLVGLPSIARASAAAQHLYVNGRAIRDRTIQHALKEAYRGLIEPSRYPTAVLLIEIDPAAVDVNVHPAKSEVRFRESGRVHSLVLRAVRGALQAADLVPRADLAGPSNAAERAFGPNAILPSSAPSSPSDRPPRSTADAAGFGAVLRDPSLRSSGAGQRTIPWDALKGAFDRSPYRDAATPGLPESPIGSPAPSPSPPAAAASAAAAAAADATLLSALPTPRVLQVHKQYVVTEDAHGIVIVDQHALHERVMFQRLLERLSPAEAGPQPGQETRPGDSARVAPPASGSLESQRLLSPAIAATSPSGVERLADLAPLLATLGIQAEPMGSALVAVQAFPTFLFEKGIEPGAFVAELLERADAEGFAPGSEETLHEILDMMACKAAIKAGDKLSEPELLELLALRETVERASNCPHGRPTSIRLTIAELDRRFGRA